MYRHEVNEAGGRLHLWGRRKRVTEADLSPEFAADAVVVEIHRVKYQDCGVTVERVPLLPSKALSAGD